MSVGNLKTYGGKGTNMPWQLKMLLGQECACDNLTDINTNTSNVDSLLNQILAAIQSGADYEAALVVDDNGVTWLEVRIYNPDTGTFDPPVQFEAGSNTPGTPAAPITYINPNSYLAQIVANTTGLATETTLGLLEAKDFATETTLLSVDTKLADAVRTPNIVRTSTSGIVNVAVYSFSVANVGLGNGTILGQTIKPGETINFDAGSLNNYYTGFAYDGTGTELLITYNA